MFNDCHSFCYYLSLTDYYNHITAMSFTKLNFNKIALLCLLIFSIISQDYIPNEVHPKYYPKFDQFYQIQQLFQRQRLMIKQITFIHCSEYKIIAYKNESKLQVAVKFSYHKQFKTTVSENHLLTKKIQCANQGKAIQIQFIEQGANWTQQKIRKTRVYELQSLNKIFQLQTLHSDLFEDQICYSYIQEKLNKKRLEYTEICTNNFIFENITTFQKRFYYKNKNRNKKENKTRYSGVIKTQIETDLIFQQKNVKFQFNSQYIVSSASTSSSIKFICYGMQTGIQVQSNNSQKSNNYLTNLIKNQASINQNQLFIKSSQIFHEKSSEKMHNYQFQLHKQQPYLMFLYRQEEFQHNGILKSRDLLQVLILPTFEKIKTIKIQNLPTVNKKKHISIRQDGKYIAVFNGKQLTIFNMNLKIIEAAIFPQGSESLQNFTSFSWAGNQNQLYLFHQGKWKNCFSKHNFIYVQDQNQFWVKQKQHMMKDPVFQLKSTKNLLEISSIQSYYDLQTCSNSLIFFNRQKKSLKIEIIIFNNDKAQDIKKKIYSFQLPSYNYNEYLHCSLQCINQFFDDQNSMMQTLMNRKNKNNNIFRISLYNNLKQSQPMQLLIFEEEKIQFKHLIMPFEMNIQRKWIIDDNNNRSNENIQVCMTFYIKKKSLKMFQSIKNITNIPLIVDNLISGKLLRHAYQNQQTRLNSKYLIQSYWQFINLYEFQEQYIYHEVVKKVQTYQQGKNSNYFEKCYQKPLKIWTQGIRISHFQLHNRHPDLLIAVMSTDSNLISKILIFQLPNFKILKTIKIQLKKFQEVEKLSIRQDGKYFLVHYLSNLLLVVFDITLKYQYQHSRQFQFNLVKVFQFNQRYPPFSTENFWYPKWMAYNKIIFDNRYDHYLQVDYLSEKNIFKNDSKSQQDKEILNNTQQTQTVGIKGIGQSQNSKSNQKDQKSSNKTNPSSNNTNQTNQTNNKLLPYYQNGSINSQIMKKYNKQHHQMQKIINSYTFKEAHLAFLYDQLQNLQKNIIDLQNQLVQIQQNNTLKQNQLIQKEEILSNRSEQIEKRNASVNKFEIDLQKRNQEFLNQNYEYYWIMIVMIILVLLLVGLTIFLLIKLKLQKRKSQPHFGDDKLAEEQAKSQMSLVQQKQKSNKNKDKNKKQGKDWQQQIIH